MATGLPIERSSSRRDMIARLPARSLPKPRPGSMASLSLGTPARTASLTRRSKNA